MTFYTNQYVGTHPHGFDWQVESPFLTSRFPFFKWFAEEYLAEEYSYWTC